MGEPSMLAMFHKAGEHGGDSSSAIDIGKEMEHEKDEAKDKDHELIETEKVINETVSLIKNISLEDEYLQDKNQKALLVKTKQQAIDKIFEVFKDTKEYMMAIRTLDECKNLRDSENQRDYLKNVENLDNARTRKHDALIADFQSTIRFISYNFSQISEGAIDKWEEEREEKGLPILKVKRMKFPKKILCPEKVNIKDRKQITTWATKVFTISLEKIKKDFSRL